MPERSTGGMQEHGVTVVRPTADHPPTTTQSVGPRVWERVWTNRPSARKDDALLLRESRSTRFGLIVDRCTSTFGAVRGLRTIELGCGRGDLSALLARRGAEVTLLDNSEAALAEARWRFERLRLPAHYVHCDILDSPRRLRRRFDVAMSYGVIEHFTGAARTRVMAAHHNVLRPGGLAVISVPHSWCLPYRFWKSYLEMRRWWPYGLEAPYTRRELTRRATYAGLEQAEIHCLEFWRSVGGHWGKGILTNGPDWENRPSLLDRWMGSILLLLARRGPMR
ncbi:MAG: methyltransferase domain-containing protein [Phycisphaerae bacterium]